jgi:hypothetical protein
MAKGTTNREMIDLREVWYRAKHMSIFARTAVRGELHPWVLLHMLQMTRSRWARYVGQTPKHEGH